MEIKRRKPFQTYTERPPTIRQIRAVKAYIAGNGQTSKADAMRQAGYAESMAVSPTKVFESRAVLKMLRDKGIDENLGIEAVQRNIRARRNELMYFPIFKAKDDSEEEGEGIDFDNSEQIRGAQMTDEDIRAFFLANDCEVYRIEHGDQTRRVYYFMNDGKTQLSAADMLFRLVGAYAPTKTEGKHLVGVGIFSMAELRKKMKQNNLEIISDKE